MLARLRNLYIPILTQITVPYLLLAIAVVAAGTFIVSRFTFESAKERFDNQLIETANLANQIVVREEQDLLTTLRLLSNIQGVDGAMQTGDRQLLQTLILPAAINDGVQNVVVVGSTGGSLLTMRLNNESQNYEQLALPAGLSAQPFIQNVLHGVEDAAGDKFAGVVETEQGAILFVSGPIRDVNGQLFGALLVGRWVDSLATQISQETLAQLTFYALDGQPLASTLSEPLALSPEKSQEVRLQQDEGSQTRPLTDNGLEFNERLSVWELRGGEDAGVLGTALGTHFLLESRFNSFGISLLTGAILLGVITVGLIVARRITLPISNLKNAAQRISEGNLLVKVPAGGRDEVGVLAQSFNEMVASLGKSRKDLLEAYEMTIEGWAKATDLRDHETEGHSRRVADLAVALAQSMGFKGKELVDLRRGALLHDIGKIAVPDAILLKKGKLTEDEMEQMRQHPIYARKFMEQIDFLAPAMDIPDSHHEKWDGTGYPRKLKGEQIPLAARLFAVVDVWDALTSDRPYRSALGFDETMKIILKDSGHHFDPQVVTAFKKLMGR